MKKRERFGQNRKSTIVKLSDKDVITFVFPVWWFSFPAMLKGYLDRVWNHGITYGVKEKLPIKTIRWVALVGGSQLNFERRGNDKLMQNFLNGGIASYTGIKDSKVEFLYNPIGLEEEIIDKDALYQSLFQQAKNVVAELR